MSNTFRFTEAISALNKQDIYNSIIANGNAKRIKQFVFHRLKKSGMDYKVAKSVYGVTISMVVQHTVDLALNPDAEIPKDADVKQDESTLLDPDSDVWYWNEDATYHTCGQSKCLTVTKSDDTPETVMNELMVVIKALIKFAARLIYDSELKLPWKYIPFPESFSDDLKLGVSARSIVCKERNASAWHSKTHDGFFVSVGGKDATMAIYRMINNANRVFRDLK